MVTLNLIGILLFSVAVFESVVLYIEREWAAFIACAGIALIIAIALVMGNSS